VLKKESKRSVSLVQSSKLLLVLASTVVLGIGPRRYLWPHFCTFKISVLKLGHFDEWRGLTTTGHVPCWTLAAGAADTHTHTHTRARARAHTHTHKHFLSLSLSLSLSLHPLLTARRSCCWVPNCLVSDMGRRNYLPFQFLWQRSGMANMALCLII
jgi:hypothetical protein